MSAKAQNGISPEIEAAINLAVGAAFAVAQRTQSAVGNHSNTVLAATSTVAISGTAGVMTQVMTATLTPKVTGKYRVHVHGVATPLLTVPQSFNIGVSYANGTGAFPASTSGMTALLNAIGVPEATGAVAGGMPFGWTFETTAIGTVGTAGNFALYAYGSNTTGMQVSGGGAQITIEEVL